MSGVGNDSTFGNLKSNYHFQLSLLQILQQVANNTAALGGGTAAQTITSSSESGSTNSPVAAGATSVGFTTSSTFVGTINGVARAASTFYGFSAKIGGTLPAIPYTVTAGSVTIDKIV